MQKKYQVFISSTYTDLIEERKKVQEILLMADCIPAGMEAFVAANDEQFEVIKKVIDLCDYYVLIIGGRYGSINETTGISYTEMEYDYAVSQNIPVLVFAIDETVDLPKKKKDTDAEILMKLGAFRAKAMTNRLASIWKNDTDLAGQVAISIMKAKIENVRPGWTRGEGFNATELLKKITDLQESNKNLELENQKLQNALNDLLMQNSDLSFEDQQLTVKYYKSSYSYTKKITLKEIFAYVSINMINVSLASTAIEDCIARAVGANGRYGIEDKNLTKKICNQFLALKLMYTKWVEGKGQYYGLTKKGEKLRDEMNLFKKEKKDGE